MESSPVRCDCGNGVPIGHSTESYLRKQNLQAQRPEPGEHPPTLTSKMGSFVFARQTRMSWWWGVNTKAPIRCLDAFAASAELYGTSSGAGAAWPGSSMFLTIWPEELNKSNRVVELSLS